MHSASTSPTSSLTLARAVRVHLEAALPTSARPWRASPSRSVSTSSSSACPTASSPGASVHARWEGECSTCLRELAADLTVGVAELYESNPVDGETYPLEGHELDLEQLVRDALAARAAARTRRASGPTAHRPSAARSWAPTTADRPTTPPADPRWAALSDLDL